MADTDDLYQQFIEVFQQRINDGGGSGIDRGEEGALDKANEFEGLTDAHLQMLMSYKSKRSQANDENSVNKRLEVMLREERNTWRLARALLKDQLFKPANSRHSDGDNLEHMTSNDVSHDSEHMDDSSGLNSYHLGQEHHLQNGLNNYQRNGPEPYVRISEDQIIGNYYMSNEEIRRMQLVTDWLEANEASDLDYKDEEDKVEFYAEGPTAWENTFHSMRAKYNIDIPDLDVTMNPNAGIELCNAMDPDAPIRTKKALAHQDKEIEIRLFKHLFRFIRAGKLDEGQELAQRVGYHWLSAILEGWLPYSDPNLDQEHLSATAINHQPQEIRPVCGNKKRDVWKQTCFKTAKMHGLGSCEKAILGVLGGNVKCVLPICHTWADQLWARLKCSIDVKIEKALRDPDIVQQENRNLIDLPQEFYDNYQSLPNIFKSIRDQKIVSQFKEATIHQTLQRYLILNDIEGLLGQLSEWCTSLDFDTTEGAVSPHFLRCFAHIVLFLREIDLISEDDPRGSKIIESYIGYLTQQKSIESVAHYSGYLLKENQTYSFAKLLATINDREERRQCLMVAKESRLDVDDITQTVVEIIRDEKPTFPFGGGTPNDTRMTPFDKRKIDALDYLLLLDTKNFIAILHHGNILLRHFALIRKMDAVKETFLKLPANLAKNVESQWRLHTNSDITPMLRNNIRELESFRHLLEVQEELSQWSEWHHKKPEEPRKPANLTKFCDNVNYEQRLKQYQQDLNVWRDLREVRTNSLADKISQMFHFEGGWMKDSPSDTGEQESFRQAEMSSIYTVAGINTPGHKPSTVNRSEQMNELRKYFVPYMVSVCFNVLQLTQRYEDCLKLSHLLAQEDLKLYEEFTKVQLQDFLSKISEVTKLIVKKSLTEDEEQQQQR
uniref:Nuclear pore complex protein n=1 Tax=Aceria tosichella TaxID=561515 RepID=A0A6G1SNR2_9ACAR